MPGISIRCGKSSGVAGNVGNYGSVKIKALRVLFEALPGTLSCRSICLYIGVPYRIIAVSLLKWVNQGSITKEDVPCLFHDGIGAEYHLEPSGNRWLQDNAGKYAGYLAELDTWQSNIDIDSLVYFIKLGFTEFDKQFSALLRQN